VSKVWLGTSWKMNKTLEEARDWSHQVAVAGVPAGIRAFVMPPHTALAAVRDVLGPTPPLLLGAQNAHWAHEGAGTGEVSMRMIADAGARMVEIGHSERRQAFGETDDTVSKKVRAAVDAGLLPLVCVGEPAATRAAGCAEDFVVAQVRAALSLLTPREAGSVLLAYEPIWAIGSAGRSATIDELTPTMEVLAATLAKLADGLSAGGLLYGGSVDLTNAALLLNVPHVDGLFVGRAAWTAAGFIDLLSAAATARAEQIAIG
jgi:triosephosphate isomerase